VAITTRGLADGPVTYSAFPALFALTVIRISRNSMQTRRYARRDVAILTFVPIKTVTCLRRRANSVVTASANSDLANQTLPSRLTHADVRLHTSSMLAIRVADSLRAGNARPALVTLAALAVKLVVLNENLHKVLIAGLICRLADPWRSVVDQCFEILIQVVRWTVIWVRVASPDFERDQVVAGWVRCAKFLLHAAARVVDVLKDDVVYELLHWVSTTILINCLVVSLRPVNRPAVVNEALECCLLSTENRVVCETLLLTAANSVLRVANRTAQPFLFALEPVETTALKGAWVIVFLFKLTVLDAGLSTAVTPVVVTLWLIVFSVASTISQPHIDARHILLDDFLEKDDLWLKLALIITVINDGRFWKLFVREHLCAWSPGISEGKAALKHQKKPQANGKFA